MPNQWVNFCPSCGKKIVEGTPNDNGTVPVRCTNVDCIFAGDGTDLLLHHPVYGIEHAPGDSFALSWIE